MNEVQYLLSVADSLREQARAAASQSQALHQQAILFEEKVRRMQHEAARKEARHKQGKPTSYQVCQVLFEVHGDETSVDIVPVAIDHDTTIPVYPYYERFGSDRTWHDHSGLIFQEFNQEQFEEYIEKCRQSQNPF